MSDHADLDELARQIIDSNLYLALGTVDPDGRPRVSPVYYTPADYSDFYWVSSPDAHHSANVAQRPQISLVIFDSTASVGQGQAVYVEADARQVPDDELAERCPVAFRTDGGARLFTPEDLSGDNPLRLYQASASQWEIHVPGGDPTHGTGLDRRAPVTPARG